MFCKAVCSSLTCTQHSVCYHYNLNSDFCLMKNYYRNNDDNNHNHIHNHNHNNNVCMSKHAVRVSFILGYFLCLFIYIHLYLHCYSGFMPFQIYIKYFDESQIYIKYRRTSSWQVTVHVPSTKPSQWPSSLQSPCSSVGRASTRCLEGHGFKPHWGLGFFSEFMYVSTVPLKYKQPTYSNRCNNRVE